ncbi:hypothetical protein [Catenulispora rubra]|uniref:hypothetical protein n=1 Tax=Catenulispora rubra TaxID=280293 RepID=UPI001E644E0C|nr:hypothetical protein [Catenulispora rubra]
MRKTSAFLAATAVAATIAIPVDASAASAATAPTGTSTAASPTGIAGTTPVPTFDFRDCPQLPTGVDPAKWRCEVLVAQGTATVGGATLPFDFTAVTHAEGPLPDGTPGQVFGGFRAARLPAPGRQSGDGHGPKLWMQPHLTTVPDFYSQSGAMTLTFQLTGPHLGEHCSIGTTAAPVQVAAARVPGSTQWLSQNPPIITFQVLDQTLAVPEVSGCGRATEELNRRFGLPSPSGANRLSGTAFYSFKTYDQL